MKKYCFMAILLLAGVAGFSQSIDDINKYHMLGQNKKAKELVDKFLTETKNAGKADGWYYKGRIYNAVSKDSGTTPTDAMKLKLEAFEAFKKYLQLDPKEVSLKNDGYVWFFDIYNGFFDIGAKEYNVKSYAGAFEGFKNALMVEEFTRGKNYEYNGYKFPSLDTSLIQNTAMAASQAKDEASAIAYYRKLTDANLSGEAFLNIYQYVTEYYYKNKDEANMKAMLDKGRSLYPNEKYWTELELEAVSKTGNKEALYAKYEELMKREPNEYSWPYNLGVELFNEVYTGDAKPANAIALKEKLSEVLKTAIAIQGDKGSDAKMLMTRHTYNDAYDYQDSSKKIKGAKPEDIKKRNEIKALFLKKVDVCIPYGEQVIAYYAAQATLKPIYKSNYKIVLDILSQLYTAKGDVKKAAEYEKKKGEVDKL
jgi:hypothetical protein